MDEIPVLRQLLICEKLIVDRDTKKVSLIACHTERRVDRFPTLPLDFVIYGLLTNGFGTFTMEVRVSKLSSDEEILHVSFPMSFDDRLRTRELICRFEGAEFAAEGGYQFVLYANGEPLAITSLTLRRDDA